MKKLSLITIPSLLLLGFNATQAVDYAWDNGVVGDNTWGATEAGPNTNWTPEGVPNSNADTAAFNGAADLAINLVDGNFTVNKYSDNFAGEGFTNTLYASAGGSLTIDINKLNTDPHGDGIINATGNTGGTLRFNNIDLIINNSAGDNRITYFKTNNTSGNIMLFDTTSTLIVNDLVQLVVGTGDGEFQLNGTLGASLASIIINTQKVTFGEGHDSSLFGQSIVLQGTSKIAINGGTVLSTGQKFQVNSSNAELELNAADTINDANIVVGGTNNFLLDVNADQTNMGQLIDIGGTLTIDLAPTVAELAFNDSSANETAWAGGSITLVNFRNKVIRFGTDNTGLTPAQLAQFGTGFILDTEGYLQNNSFPDPTVINVSLEQSTDLINWTPADEGAYLLYPAEGLFFRARIDPAP